MLSNKEKWKKFEIEFLEIDIKYALTMDEVRKKLMYMSSHNGYSRSKRSLKVADSRIN